MLLYSSPSKRVFIVPNITKARPILRVMYLVNKPPSTNETSKTIDAFKHNIV